MSLYLQCESLVKGASSILTHADFKSYSYVNLVNHASSRGRKGGGGRYD
jgi:hypothetical protein